MASDYYIRQRESVLNDMVSASADAVKLGRGPVGEGQENMITVPRLAAKIEFTKIRASRLREHVN